MTLGNFKRLFLRGFKTKFYMNKYFKKFLLTNLFFTDINNQINI